MAYTPSSEEEKQFLQDYDPSGYQNPAVAADTALFALCGDALMILLIRRGGYPYKGKWALPGGFVDIGEELRAAAERELFEETGISGVYLEQAFVWGRVDRDPRQRTITVSFIALSDGSKLSAEAGDDAACAEWFALGSFQKETVDGTTYIRYKLRSKAETLSPIVSYPQGRPQEISCVFPGGLAFDHAESVAYSFECLKQRVMHEQFLLFAFENERQGELAKEIILGI